MAQTASASYQELDASPSKRPDFLLAIAGWPTIYSVADDAYALSAGAHNLSSTNGFTTIRKWSELPKISETKVKGDRPEGGTVDIGDMTVELLDKHGISTVTRDLTDLLSRQAYLEGNRTGAEYQLSATVTLTKAATSVVLVSTAGIVAGDVIHITQEAILVGAVNGDGITLTGCTRGYLLTNATRHEVGVKVYGYIPNLKGRPIWLFKGYRDLTLPSWLKAWGGMITSVGRGEPGKVVIQARATTWAMWGGSAPSGRERGTRLRGAGNSPAAGVRRLVRVGAISTEAEAIVAEALVHSLAGDYRGDIKVPLSVPTGLGDGHYMIRAGEDALLGICNPLDGETEIEPGLTKVEARFVKGLGRSPEAQLVAGTAISLAWTNATFSATAAPTGSEPIDLILQLLTSTGTATNGAYDVFKKGIGLGIPVEQIDLTSFTNVQAENDYDLAGTRVFFVFTESVDAKTFIDEELCKPFGWYLATGNDGRIKLVRPKNPIKLYFSKANNEFTFTHSADPSTTRQFTLPAGVYTPAQVATALQAGLRAASGASLLTVAWSGHDAYEFFIDVGGGTMSFSATDAWKTLGFNIAHTLDAAPQSDIPVAYPPNFNPFGAVGETLNGFPAYSTVTKNDVHAGSLVPIRNDSARVARINFGCNYSWAEDSFDYKVFVDAEIENLSPFGEAQPYEINSKGLLRAFVGTKKTNTPWSVRLPPTNGGCTGIPAEPSSSFGIDASGSFASLFCSHLFDRYRNPPQRFKCRLKWRFNTREIGDVLSFTHDVDGVALDAERGTANLSARLFEIVGIRPDPKSMCVEVELLGHRLGS